MDLVSIQQQDFDHQECYAQLCTDAKQGAIVTFTGLVRDFSADQALSAIELEHYPGMTEKALQVLVAKAHARFDIAKVVLIHRIGRLSANEQIVFVGVSSQHRKSAFEAAQFFMDRLKNDVPLWKKEIDTSGKARWVAAKESDRQAGESWSQ
jgi:molybdopterin synthase catalytic subunit